MLVGTPLVALLVSLLVSLVGFFAIRSVTLPVRDAVQRLSAASAEILEANRADLAAAAAEGLAPALVARLKLDGPKLAGAIAGVILFHVAPRLIPVTAGAAGRIGTFFRERLGFPPVSLEIGE